MPFFEVYDFDAAPSTRAKATKLITEAICDTYGIEANIVSAYFINVGSDSYGHEGLFGSESTKKRIFVKLHAFQRPDGARRAAARAITRALAEAYGIMPNAIAVYFLDRDPSQISHGGVLASD